MTAGTDIVSVARVARILETRGSRFLVRWFTDDEIAFCAAQAHPNLHFAARLAAKEAVFKALGTTRAGPIPWRLIEICHAGHGVPTVRLSGWVLAAAQESGVGDISVSLSHCDEYATAVATAGEAC